MEALSYFLRRAREGGFLASFKVNGRDGEGLEVTHLLFVDDILVFCEVSRAQMTYLSWLLMWFEVISNMKINLTKSEFILIGSVEDLALEIGCKVGVLPTTYLGLPLGTPHNLLVAWDGVEERFCKRLAWSKGGRLILIRSTLSGLPIYLMSLFQISRIVCLRLEKIQRDFLWGGETLESKPHSVKWATICSDKRNGGLRVRCLHSLNKALLCKLNWRFASTREAHWRQII